ncbi:hypothetical protein [Bernardetia sp. MNP-M8]|uniref:hypothetical protein n=1 Tax=Bernardetia sp. MNP-M8 TaxID=3127470 RepID=UPI0030CF4711
MFDFIKNLANQFLNTPKLYGNTIDYSYGNEVYRHIRSNIILEKYDLVEEQIQRLNCDDLSTVIDFITLTVDENILLEWIENSNSRDIPILMLGVFYNHEGWKARTHALYREVSQDGRKTFSYYQQKGLETLYKVSENTSLLTELYSRLMQFHMGESELDTAIDYFQKAKNRTPNDIWIYLRYSELIQPKWGGDEELVRELLANLPNHELSRQITLLKIIGEAYQAEINYFGNNMSELDKKANEILYEIDRSVSQNPPSSIHRYTLYCYLTIVAETINNHLIAEKYFAKMNGYYTLYPFGINPEV